MNSKKGLFLSVESIIYITFIVFDLTGLNSIYIKYLGIMLCFLFALLNRKRYISITLLFTLISDYFLLIRNDNYLVGIISFIIVQFIYFLYLENNNCKKYIKIRIFIYFLIVIVSIFFKLNILYCLTLLYFSTLITNTISSYTNKDLIIFSYGLTLFIGCDICVGLFNILPIGKIYMIVSLLMWVFYLPSQVLIALSKDS